MPKQPKTVLQTKEKGQISAPGGDIVNYLYRIVPNWLSPIWWEAQKWRTFVQNQPIAVVFRETLISYLQALDWAIVPRDADKQDELKEEIKYYTKLFENTNGYYSELDFSSHIEFVGKDLLDLPFGGAAEIGREDDSPDGKVVWIRPLDGGTLAPTLNKEWPVMQRIPDYNVADPVFFPSDSISRIFMSPRTELRREGWGMAPPEKIYLALELLWRGDKYYADLLLNTPEVGILDLGDMEKSSAEQWVKSFQDLMYGVNPMKIPVVYEHTTETKWIPFGKLPNDIMFDGITRKYASIVGAGYGMTLDDIGMGGSSGNGGNTLAGTIRSERHTSSSGKAVCKKKFINYFNKFLPEYLMFKWIDYNAEEQVASGRAMLAFSQGAKTLIDSQVFSPDEMRTQAIRSGIINILVPEKLDRKSIEWPVPAVGKLGSAEQLDKKVSSASGGHGEGSTKPTTVIRSESEIATELKMLADIREIKEMQKTQTDAEQKPINVTVNNNPSSPLEIRADGITFAAPEQPAPIVNVTIEPTPVTVQNVIPEQSAPVVNVESPAVIVNVEPTPITIQNDVQVDVPAPIVNVEAPQISIEPTPVQIDKSKPKKVKITRDQYGQIDGIEEKS